VENDGEVPEAYGKVIRKQASGEWRRWFTEEDVEVSKPTYLPYMDIIGYNCNGRALNPHPVIEPQYSWVYMQSLPKRVLTDTVRRFKDRIVQRLLLKAALGDN
jgi:hypothetical protein